MSDELALLGGSPLGAPNTPPFPVFDAAAIKEATRLLASGRTVGLGRSSQPIAAAEAAISRYHGGRETMVLNSGHAALMAALMGLEIGPGDEVITTPYTWGASTACILHVGAIPVFVDVNPLTGLIDPAAISPAITPRTKAVLAVHLYGQPCDMAAINRIAKRHKLYVIEDGSQAHGATIDGQVVGNFSDAAGFSCMGGKLLATSEAGYLVTPHADVFWRAAMMCQHYGRSGEAKFPSKFRPYVDSLVFTFRLSPVIAALLPSQLRRLNPQVAARQRNADAFRRAMKDCHFVQFPEYGDGIKPSYHMLTMNHLPQVAGVRRDVVLKAFSAEGVGAFAYVPSGIHTWRRLDWRNYQGPVPYWLEGLRRAGTRYDKLRLPNCQAKIAAGIEMGWNFYKPADADMKRLASAFLKVQKNLPALARWQKRQDEQETAAEGGDNEIVKAARRAVAAYKRK